MTSGSSSLRETRQNYITNNNKGTNSSFRKASFLTMSTAEDLKALGNAAFKENKMDEAIEAYSKAIALEENHIFYSNRSAAYLTKGDAEKALADAITCLELNPDFVKGYSRKGAALQGLKQYAAAVQALEDGLAKFPENPDLTTELTKCRNAMAFTGENQVKARQSVAAKRASVSLSGKAGSSETMTDFVKVSKMALEMQIFALQAQLQMIDSLSEMSDEEKLTMLFGLIDTDRDGRIDARELADALRKRNADLAFADSIERAISFVAAFDTDKDAKLDLNEFKEFLDAILKAMGVTFHELSEFLILQNIFSESGNDFVEDLAGALVSEDINEAVLAKEEFFDASTDPRMMVLFNLFDLDGDGSVDFKEVAIGLYRLTDDMEDAARMAVVVLLMFDKDDKRTLNFEEFAKLMLHVVTAAETKFDDMADKMTLAMVSKKEVTDDDVVNLISGEVLYNLAKDEQEDQMELLATIDALQYGRMQKLFDLWDTDKNGVISFAELLTGMRKFNGAIDMEESVARAAIAMIGFDDNDTQTLDRVEFARALVNFAKASEVDVRDLIDFMVVATVVEDDSPEEVAYIKAIASQATSEIKAIQGALDAYEIE